VHTLNNWGRKVIFQGRREILLSPCSYFAGKWLIWRTHWLFFGYHADKYSASPSKYSALAIEKTNKKRLNKKIKSP
jgi:hypothetical protein